MPSVMEDTGYGDYYTSEALPSRGSTHQPLHKFPLTYPFLTNHISTSPIHTCKL